MNDDFYATLGVTPAATRAQIKAAYLAALDRAATRAELDRLVAAFTMLSDSNRRILYDAERAAPAALRPELEALEPALYRDPANTAARLGSLARRNPYPALLLVAGRMLLATEQFPKARRIFQSLCELEPGNVDALCLQGEALMEEGRVAQARALLEQAIATDPGHSRALFLAAQTLFSEQFDSPEAIGLMERALAACRESASARLYLLANYFLPVLLLEDARRMQAMTDELLELLPKASISAQDLALTIVNHLAGRFPPGQFPTQARLLWKLQTRLDSYLSKFNIPDPMADALEKERACLQADQTAPDWIRRLAGSRNLLAENDPLHLTEENPPEECRAVFQAWVRLEGRQAEWAAFAAACPVLAGRIPASFCLYCFEGWPGKHGGH